MAKRLYKSDKDKQVSGVCQGIAEYFDMDPSIVRIAFAFTILFMGTGLLLYIIMAIVLPEKKEVMNSNKSDDIYESYDDNDY